MENQEKSMEMDASISKKHEYHLKGCSGLVCGYVDSVEVE
jgi:hypothetical protein